MSAVKAEVLRVSVAIQATLCSCAVKSLKHYKTYTLDHGCNMHIIDTQWKLKVNVVEWAALTHYIQKQNQTVLTYCTVHSF